MVHKNSPRENAPQVSRLRGSLLANLVSVGMPTEEQGIEPADSPSPALPVKIVEKAIDIDDPDYQVFSLEDEDGKEVGAYDLHWGGVDRKGRGLFRIGVVEVTDERLVGHRDTEGNWVRGIGRDLYRHIATQTPPPAHILGDGHSYHLTGGSLNEISEAVWRGFVERGEAEREFSRYTFLQPNAYTVDR